MKTSFAPGPTGFDEQEWAARCELASCYRLFDFLGWTETIYNHITLRIPGGPHAGGYLINPFGLHYGEVTAANLLSVDLEGNVIAGPAGEANKAGLVIHSAIHAARSDAHCVMHTHTTAGCAVACKESGLRHDNFYSAMLYEAIAYHDYEGVTTTRDEQPRIVVSLGERNLLILRNHGLLAIGSTVAEAFHRLWVLQRACEIQLASDGGIGGNRTISEDILLRVPSTRLDRNRGSQLMFDAMLRKARIGPGSVAD